MIRPAAIVAISGSALAALVHASAAGSHEGDDVVVWMFSLCAVAQLGWAALAAARPSRLVFVIGGLINGGAVLVWVLSRTTGVPFVDALSEPEKAGAQDLVAALGASAAVLGAAVVLVRPKVVRRVSSAWSVLVPALALVAAVPAMAADHSHEHEDAGDTDVAAHTHDAGEVVPTASGPIISLDDPRVTPNQRAEAERLIATTADGMAAFPDVEAVTAAGYRSIGDAVTGFEHFVNYAYLLDGREVDPARIESVVVKHETNGSKKVASAMYILSPGKTMADVPDIAGELTTWHDHQNLCWEGLRVVAVTVNGACPRGTFRPTPPMLHVWMVPHPCGPFAGIDGHGERCEHDHTGMRSG